MRAYMSEPCGYAGARITVPIKAQRESAQYALKEAHRILAETERLAPGTYGGHWSLVALTASVRHPGLAFTLGHDIQASLAESLAAFVGERN